MRHRGILAAILPLTFIALRAPAQGSAKGAEVLTNQSIVQMVLAKLPTDVIQAKIQSSKSDFDVTVAGLSGLEANKIPTAIMKSMLTSGPKKGTGEVLTNESVIQMVTARIPHDVILAKIQATKTNFDVTSDGLVSLNTNKVPKDILKVMMAGSN